MSANIDAALLACDFSLRMVRGITLMVVPRASHLSPALDQSWWSSWLSLDLGTNSVKLRVKTNGYFSTSDVSSLVIAMLRPLFRLADAMGFIVISPVSANRGFDAPMPKDLAQCEVIFRVIVEPTMSI